MNAYLSRIFTDSRLEKLDSSKKAGKVKTQEQVSILSIEAIFALGLLGISLA
ncbi:hypothetical protein [Mongoliibacter ruber]|uniref:hypothetical protein n=1 Tax=Mongoliibacter ruber TaxID=1750599 RepID=UPI0014741AC4|nr:hypothetical protein [Mongoliibacter ruber]